MPLLCVINCVRLLTVSVILTGYEAAASNYNSTFLLWNRAGLQRGTQVLSVCVSVMNVISVMNTNGTYKVQ